MTLKGGASCYWVGNEDTLSGDSALYSELSPPYQERSCRVS